MPTNAQPTDPDIPWPQGHTPASAVVFAHNAVDIVASPQKAWSLLIDCTAWPRWYKRCSDVSIIKGGSHLEAGSKFRFKTLNNYFEPDIVTFDACRMLVWSARGPAGTSGSHAWHIKPHTAGCTVVTEEAQTGLLLWLVRSRIRVELIASHEEWLLSLKRLAESDRHTTEIGDRSHYLADEA